MAYVHKYNKQKADKIKNELLYSKNLEKRTLIKYVTLSEILLL